MSDSQILLGGSPVPTGDLVAVDHVTITGTGSVHDPLRVKDGSASIVWGGDATWTDVMAAVNASETPTSIYVTQDQVIPDGIWSMRFAKLISLPTIGAYLVAGEDGAQLHNLGYVTGEIELQGNNTALPFLTFDYPINGTPAVLILNFNGTLSNNGSVPLIEIPDNKLFVLAGILNSAIENPGTSIVFNLGTSSQLILGALGTMDWPADIVAGAAGTALVYLSLTNGIPSPLPSQAGMLGWISQAVDNGASCTGVGTRPTDPIGALRIGSMVLDQSLGAHGGKPIWWNGTAWIDATGALA